MMRIEPRECSHLLNLISLFQSLTSFGKLATHRMCALTPCGRSEGLQSTSATAKCCHSNSIIDLATLICAAFFA